MTVGDGDGVAQLSLVALQHARCCFWTRQHGSRKRGFQPVVAEMLGISPMIQNLHK